MRTATTFGTAAVWVSAWSLLVPLGGCGGGGRLIERAPSRTKAPAPAPVRPDAFRDFGGKVVAPGERFRVQSRPVGVKELRVVIELVKTEWTERELPSGKTVKDGTADLIVRKGEKRHRLRLDEGESRVVLGARVLLYDADEGYDSKRMDYLPWIDVVVTKP